MSLEEVFTENPPVSRADALRCIRQHNCGDQLEEFFTLFGDQDEYSSKEVLEFLGY